MEKAKIGAILRKRIKEKGYTQEEFAEKSGIPIATLKNYMSGKNTYDYEILDILSDTLDCSYDYLLGKSESPKSEYHDVAKVTRLSENAINTIAKYASVYDDEFEGRRYIKCLDMLITEDDTLGTICDYMLASKLVNNLQTGMVDILNGFIRNNEVFKKIGIEEDKTLTLESQLMINIIVKLKNIKAQLTPEFIKELKALDTEENYQKNIDMVIEKIQEWASENLVGYQHTL